MLRCLHIGVSLLTVASISGCIAVYGHRQVVVEVTDFETGEPVEGAELRVSYPTMFQLNPPESIEATTPASGRLDLRVPTFRDGGHWSVWKRDEYLSTGLHSPFGSWARERLPDVIDGDHIRFRMLREPQPTAVSLVQEGFTGLLRLEFEPQPIIPGPITRHFEITVPSDGLVRIRLAEGLQAVNWNETSCLYPDGTLVGSPNVYRKREPEERGKAWLGNGPNRMMFFIGTASEARRAYELVNDVEYDKLGGMTSRANEERFQAVFDKPGILD